MKLNIAIFILIVFSSAFVTQDKLPLGAPPKELPIIDTSNTKITWNDIVQGHYDNFSYSKHYEKDSALFKRMITQATFVPFGVWYGKKETFGKKLSIQFYKSQPAQKALYKWIKPHYISAYKQLPAWKKKIYNDMLLQAKKYITTFDYKGELKIYNSDPDGFCYHGRKGSRGNYGRMEAFIFRRVHNGDMTIQQMNYWADIFLNDLKSIKY